MTLDDATAMVHWAPGLDLGPVTLLADLGERWRVCWACCGLEVALTLARLSDLASKFRAGRRPLCAACAKAAAIARAAERKARALARAEALAHTNLLPAGQCSAALAWPRPTSCRFLSPFTWGQQHD